MLVMQTHCVTRLFKAFLPEKADPTYRPLTPYIRGGSYTDFDRLDNALANVIAKGVMGKDRVEKLPKIKGKNQEYAISAGFKRRWANVPREHPVSEEDMLRKSTTIATLRVKGYAIESIHIHYPIDVRRRGYEYAIYVIISHPNH